MQSPEPVALARVLESTGRALGGRLGADLLVYAADILRAADTEAGLEMADALLVRARQVDPGCHLAVDRTLRSAAERGDWFVLADALGQAAELVETPEARGPLLAQRAEVLGRRLGRLEDARMLYLQAAELSPPLSAAALAAADDVEARLKEHMGHEAPWPDVVWSQPAFDPLLAAGMPVSSRSDPALDRYRSRLAEGYDAAIFAGALADGLERGVVDTARRVLPGMSSERRVAELEGLIANAEAAGDIDGADRFRTAAFAEVPVSAEYYAAARQHFTAQLEARIEVLLRRRRVIEDVEEMEALLTELGRLAASAGHSAAAAEAYIELLRMPQVQDWSEVLATVDQLARAAGDRWIWTRGLAAATAREGLDVGARRQLMQELARVLEEDLKDEPSATALRAELAIAGGLTGFSGRRRAERPSPVFDAEPGPDDIRSAWQRGDLPTAVRMLKQARLPDPVTFALWLEVAELAEVLGQDELARLGFEHAFEHAEDDHAQRVARSGQARLAERTGAKREAARALADVAEARVVAQAHLAARDVMSARAAFGRALDQDPSDVEAASALARLHAEDGNRRTVDQLGDSMASHPMSDDRRAVWLTELAMALHRLGDHSAARRDFVKAMRLDVANTRAAEGLVTLGADAKEPSWMDEGLSSLRARWAARGDWMRAYVAAAVLVGRRRASAADRLTYESLRTRFNVHPQSALPPGWVGRWLGLVLDAQSSSSPPPMNGRPWRPTPELDDVVSTLQALFRAPEPEWYEDDGPSIRIGTRPILVVGRSVPRWRRRWRFEVGRALAALVEPRLAAGLSAGYGTAVGRAPAGPRGADLGAATGFAELSSDDRPPSLEALVVDRAGLVAAGDPAIALAAVGPDSPRGWGLVPFAISDTLVAMWRSVGMGLREERGGLGPAERS